MNTVIYLIRHADTMDEKGIRNTDELRGYDTSIQFIKDFEDKKIYPLEIFNNTKYVR